MSDYGNPPMEMEPPKESMKKPEKGKLHTIIVAPEKGVLRYVPMSVDAEVGDTVRFVWMAGAEHTVTRSSALEVCNKTEAANAFTSGIKTGPDGNFDFVVDTKEPTFFYCSVGQHCKSGMFGVINPARGGSQTVESVMPDMLEKNADLKSAWANISSRVNGTDAAAWGKDFSLESIPDWAQVPFVQSLFYTRDFYNANQGALEANSGAITADGKTLKIPDDVTALLANSNQDPNAANQPAGKPTGAAPNPTDLSKKGSASAITSPRVAVAVVAVAAALLAF
jgi:plastocyanin